MGYKTAGAARGALGGAAKGAAIGSVVPGIGTAIGGVAGGILGGLGGLFGSRGKEKAAEAERQAAIAAGQLKADQAEDSRLAAHALASGMMPGMAQRGFITIDPEKMAALGQRRDYSDLIEKSAGDPMAGAGSAMAAGLFSDALDIAGDYASGKMSGGAGLDDLEASGITSQLSPEEEAWLRPMPEDE